MAEHQRLVRAEERSVTADLLIHTGPAEIFDLLTNPALHSIIDGSSTVRGDPRGATRLHAGSTFTMEMRQAGRRYRSMNKVVEYAENELITWASTGTWRGRTIIGGQRWRWQLLPHPEGTLVRHSYVWGYARWPMITLWLPGYPARARRTLPESLSRLRKLADQ